MSIKNLMEIKTGYDLSKAEQDRIAAEKQIREGWKNQQEYLMECFPALFADSNPITKWVVTEPPKQLVYGDGSWSLAAVLEDTIILYIYRNSAYTQITVAKYVRGSADCWAKHGKDLRTLGCPTFERELKSDVKVRESDLADLIATCTKS